MVCTKLVLVYLIHRKRSPFPKWGKANKLANTII